MPFTISGNIELLNMDKHTKLLIIICIIFLATFAFIFLKFNRIKLAKCYKNADKERREAIVKAHDEGTLSNDKIIGIEQATDRKKQECLDLYK